MNHIDKSFIARLVDGDRVAQRELYNLFAPRMLSISKRYVIHRDVAEDITHDTFLKIFGSIQKFRYNGEGSLRAWIERITVNKSLDWLRQNKKHGLVELNENLRLEDSELGDELDFESVAGVPQAVLMEMIAELPDGYRTVFNLYCIEEYSHKEIAKELGINQKSCSSQLHRAKRLLVSKIKDYIEDNGQDR